MKIQKPEEMDDMKNLEPEIDKNDILAAVNLHSLQFIKLTSNEILQINQITHRHLRQKNYPFGPESPRNARKNELKKRKAESLNVEIQVLPQPQPQPEPEPEPEPLQLALPDAYVPPRIPPIRGLNGLIKNCTIPFEKQLTVTDLRASQSRLSFSRHDAEEMLLPMVKRMNLNSGISVNVYDMNGNLYPMIFKFWSEKYYVLNCGWREFYNYHDLKPVVDFVTVWMFRHGVTKKLCFALSTRRCSNVHHLIKKVRRN